MNELLYSEGDVRFAVATAKSEIERLTAERDRLKASATLWHDRYTAKCQEAKDRQAILGAEIVALEAERDALRADADLQKGIRATLAGKALAAAFEGLGVDRKDTDRINYLERNPKLGEIHIDGEVTDCYYYAVSGAPGVKLREIIDAAMGEKT